jgi:UDP-N-acetylglucosamine 1-carboxyvinyltransferase
MTRSPLRIVGADINQLASFVDFLVRGGCVIEYDGSSITASGDFTDKAFLKTEPYPGFPTDLQPQSAPLLAKFEGGTITETVWKNRFGYLAELSKFGVIYDAYEGTANIKKSNLRSANAKAPDLRGGIALLITALSTEGQSIISDSEIINRGYANIVNKLQSVGADIYETK